MRHDVLQLNDYRGLLGWHAYTDGSGSFRPAVQIPLYIKDHPIPFRRPKPTEVSTIPMQDPISGKGTEVQAIFWGVPDILQITISGWIITPYINNRWQLKSPNGAPIYTSENITYGELISAYIEGRLNLSAGGAWQRKDPDYYITPYGHGYYNPIIATWEPQGTINPVKQAFQMTLILEK